jgi:hypothetical protein
MRVFEIFRNGVVLCIAGASNADLLDVQISGSVEGPEPARLSVSGVNGLPDDRSSHVCWLDQVALAAGDEVTIAFVDSDSVTTPAKDVASDSKEYLAEQRRSEERILALNSPPPPRKRVLPALRFSLLVNGAPMASAVLEGSREFISYSQFWKQWHPDRCRFSLSSFSGEEAFERTDGHEWMRRSLVLGDRVTVKVDI